MVGQKGLSANDDPDGHSTRRVVEIIYVTLEYSLVWHNEIMR